jgi:uncharacterized protein (TIRG00374 family)
VDGSAVSRGTGAVAMLTRRCRDRPGMNRLQHSLLSLAAAIALIAALVWFSGLSLQDLSSALGAFPLIAAVAYLCLTVALVALSALKWKRVVEVFEPDPLRRAGAVFYFQYTALGQLLGQVLPLHVSSATARSLALRMHQRMPVVRGIATSVVEQIFDVLIPAVFLVPSLLLLSGAVALYEWAALVLCLIAATAMLIALLAEPLFLVLARGLDALSGRWRMGQMKKAALALHEARDLGLFERRLALTMFALSLVRFLVLTARVEAVVAGLALPVGFAELMEIMPLAQLSLVLAFTPGSLGVSEWAWTGLLGLVGVDLEPAVVLVLVRRLLALSALAAVFLISTAVFQLSRYANRGPTG